MTINDEKTNQKAIDVVADIYGVDSIAADVKEQKLTVIGEMDTVAMHCQKTSTRLAKLKFLPWDLLKKTRKTKRNDCLNFNLSSFFMYLLQIETVMFAYQLHDST
ncbi:hypothetical protein V6N13_046871 [Hibiscus sabdariffa]